MESRKKRVRERYGEWPDQSLEARILDKDKKRSLYYRHYTGMEWGNAKNYHLSMDSSVLGIDRCVAWIVELAKQS